MSTHATSGVTPNLNLGLCNMAEIQSYAIGKSALLRVKRAF